MPTSTSHLSAPQLDKLGEWCCIYKSGTQLIKSNFIPVNSYTNI